MNSWILTNLKEIQNVGKKNLAYDKNCVIRQFDIRSIKLTAYFPYSKGNGMPAGFTKL